MRKEQLQLSEISIEITYKLVKNIHLSVYPPVGRVKVSAPEEMNSDTVRAYLISRVQWIRKQQQKLQEQERESKRYYIERESHYLWGKRYLLTVNIVKGRQYVELSGHSLKLFCREDTSIEKKGEIFGQWYRQQLRGKLDRIVKKWSKTLEVEPSKVIIQKMKTRWGSCSRKTGAIRINLELAKKPLNCLEYIVVHELVHLLEPTHNKQFHLLMDKAMPDWKHHKDILNALPLKHEEWVY